MASLRAWRVSSTESGNRAGVRGVSTRMTRPGRIPVLVLVLADMLGAAGRITVAVDDNRRVTLAGHVSPRVTAAVDQGPVDPGMQLPYVTVVLKGSAAQQADLERLSAEQQDAGSANYHAWLTPEQYADRFGLGQADIDKIAAWLGGHGLTVKRIARGRNAISFGGDAGEIGNAFGTEIHSYLAAGEPHYANATEPSIPAAFQDVVLAIQGLHDFHLKPMLQRSLLPRYNFDGEHVLAPDDIATIYDIAPLYKAGIDGTGHNLAVVGEVVVTISDIAEYRSHYNLPAKNPTTMLVPGSQTPSATQTKNELAEADLDLELSGAVARNANIVFVYSTNAIDSFQYAIDSNVAPVISISYGDCELQTPSSEVAALETWGAQASAQGQTIFAAAGDNGALDCSGGDNPATNNSLSADLPSALPQVTGVGGTEFNEGSGNYWSTTNTANFASALTYIPETAWNDNCGKELCAGGGGVSIYFAKPSWQLGAGVPDDGFRDVPDVALAASPNHDGYLIYSAGQAAVIGGTSAGAPEFAGIALLLSQYLVDNGFQSTPGLGNINQALYQNLAPVSGVFHDITTGNNKVPPCTSSGCAGTAVGYSAGPGYDQVTGLGSPDVYNLVTNWHTSGVTAKYPVTVTVAANPNRVAFTDTTAVTANVTATSGGAPTGTVTFLLGSEALGTAALSSGGSATLTVNAVMLAVGSNTVTAQYNGDNNHYGASFAVNVIETTPSNGFPSVKSVADSASFSQSFAPGGILSVFGTQLAPATASAPSIPLPTMLAGMTVTIDGYPAPLYYVSPTQINLQIPYEVTPGSSVSLHISNNGLGAFDSFAVGAAAPAIFTTNAGGTGQGAILNLSDQLVDASNPATPGTTYLQIYCMGLGAVSHQPADGAASPGNPLADTSNEAQVTIGGVEATAIFTGLAPGYVGLYQVDVLVPASVAAGSTVPVFLTIGGVTSNTATIVVGQ